MTISIELPEDLEEHFQEIVKEDYGGDLQAALRGLVELHDKYGWKDQLGADVNAIRTAVRSSGGIKIEKIDQAIKKYRKMADRGHA